MAVADLSQEGFRFESINVLTNPTKAMEYNVQGVPTFIYLVHGTEVRRLTGSTSKGMIRNVFRKPMF